jgi:hypothetical protein
VNDTPTQSTLREWRQVMTHRSTLAVMVAIAVVLTVAGPFDTDVILRAVPRFGYWMTMIVATYSAGFWVNTLIEKQDRWQVPNVLRVVLSGCATAVVVAVVVTVINGLTLNYWPSIDVLPVFLANIFVIAFGVAVIFQILSTADAPVPAEQPIPSILDRLPLDKRGTLIAISVEDHYVNVQTSKGNEMILMRLSDAIREVGATNGLQVHRSHWIAIDAVTSATRKGDGAILTLQTGNEIPVSRANVPAIREAGLLPRSAND